MEGETKYSIPDVGFELTVTAQTFELPETNGVLVVGRILPSGEPFNDVLRNALAAKVPKLVATAADEHVLLFEDGGTAIGFGKIGKKIYENIETLPDLKKVDAVWSIHTMGWKSEGSALFFRVWPGWTGERFWIKDLRFVKRK